MDVGKGNFMALLRVLKRPTATEPSKLGLATAGNSSGCFQRVAKYSLHPKAYAISLLWSLRRAVMAWPGDRGAGKIRHAGLALSPQRLAGQGRSWRSVAADTDVLAKYASIPRACSHGESTGAVPGVAMDGA